MVNYGRKKCKIYGDKLIKKSFDKANNQIWYCKHYHRHYVFKIKDFNVSKLTFYRKINKFRNTNIFLPGDSQQYDQILCWCLMVVIYFLMYYIYLFFETLLEN